MNLSATLGAKVGCKRFLPTTGTIIEASCGE